VLKYDHAPELIDKKYTNLMASTDDETTNNHLPPDDELRKVVKAFKAEYTLIPAPGVVGKFQQ